MVNSNRDFRRELIGAAAVAALQCFVEEVVVMIKDYAHAPDSVQPASLTRFTECLTRPDLLGQDSHRGIAVSTKDSPAAPVAECGQAPATSTSSALHVLRSPQLRSEKPGGFSLLFRCQNGQTWKQPCHTSQRPT